MNFSAFKSWRDRCLRTVPDLFDCAETNVYRSLASVQPKPAPLDPNRTVHRCDLARAWLRRYGYPDDKTNRALICNGVRHALGHIFRELAKDGAVVWMPRDVYPVYLELARTAGIEPLLFPTLPEPNLPDQKSGNRLEYMLVTNPWKPLGRFLSTSECNSLLDWLKVTPQRHLLVDCVYDLGAPLHPTTQKLWNIGQVILLHSLTKGWLWPKVFGVALVRDEVPNFESIFRDNPPSQEQLGLAEQLISTHANVPAQVEAALIDRKNNLLSVLPKQVRSCLLLNAAGLAPGGYFFPVAISAEELLRTHRILSVPASAFGADWHGSVITSLAETFVSKKTSREPL